MEHYLKVKTKNSKMFQMKEEIEMVNLIASKKGSGKTKTIIDLANSRLKDATGNIVFIDDDKKHMYQLKHDLRFISMDEYPIQSKDEFVGFICGVISNDYDIEDIYIDGLFKVMDIEMQGIPSLVERLEKISDRFNINFTMTLSCDTDLIPSSLESYIK